MINMIVKNIFLLLLIHLKYKNMEVDTFICKLVNGAMEQMEVFFYYLNL